MAYAERRPLRWRTVPALRFALGALLVAILKPHPVEDGVLDALHRATESVAALIAGRYTSNSQDRQVCWREAQLCKAQPELHLPHPEPSTDDRSRYRQHARPPGGFRALNYDAK
jgi:hypothetical protein